MQLSCGAAAALLVLPWCHYWQTLEVLKAAKECGVYTKSSIMLGLGETDDEVIDTMFDLKVRYSAG